MQLFMWALPAPTPCTSYSVWAPVCLYVCMYLCIYVCMYSCMYVYMYVCMYCTSYKRLTFYACFSGMGTGMLRAAVQACYRYIYGHCVIHIVQLKSKWDGGIRSERWFRMSVGSGIDADCTEKTVLVMEYYRINGVVRRWLQAYTSVATCGRRH